MSKEIKIAYGAGKKIGICGIGFVIMAFFLSDEFLNPEIEWHFLSTSLPFFIPNTVMYVIWWLIFLLGCAAIVAASLPKQFILVDDQNIYVPGIWSRSMKKYDRKDILDVIDDGSLLNIVVRSGTPATILNSMVSKEGYQQLKTALSSTLSSKGKR